MLYFLGVHRFNGYAKSKLFGKLAMGRLLGNLKESMDQRRRGASELKFALNSCHDTSRPSLPLLDEPLDGRITG